MFWRRTERGVTADGARALASGEAAALDFDVIHSNRQSDRTAHGSYPRLRRGLLRDAAQRGPWDIKEGVRSVRESNERFAAWQAGRSCA